MPNSIPVDCEVHSSQISLRNVKAPATARSRAQFGRILTKLSRGGTLREATGHQSDFDSAVLSAAFRRGIIGDGPAHSHPNDGHPENGYVVFVGKVAADSFDPLLAERFIAGRVAFRRSEALELEQKPVLVLNLASQSIETVHGFRQQGDESQIEFWY